MCWKAPFTFARILAFSEAYGKYLVDIVFAIEQKIGGAELFGTTRCLEQIEATCRWLSSGGLGTRHLFFIDKHQAGGNYTTSYVICPLVFLHQKILHRQQPRFRSIYAVVNLTFRICSISSGVKSFSMPNISRISSTLLPLIRFATALQPVGCCGHHNKSGSDVQ